MQRTIRRGTPAELELLIALVRESYDRPAWHGPNLRAALRGVDAPLAAVRPAGGAHSIWDLTLHTSFWLHIVTRRLTGEAGTFARPGHDWPRAPESTQAASEAAWRADLRLLAATYACLLEAIAGLDPRRLHQPARGHRRQTPAVLLRGVACHNLYHAGQIRLLRRMARG
jgi:uncharacterized damage-inducible protein DinB